MKHLFITATLALFSLSAFANRHIQCDLKITENEVKCPLGIGLFCKQKELKESKITLLKEISDGQIIEENLALNKVVLYPGTKKQEKYNIYLLEGDERATKLREDKEVDLVEFQTNESIRYSISNAGNTTHIEFSNGSSKYRFAITGEYSGDLLGWIHVNVADEDGFRKLQPVLLTCRQISSNIINESELEKKAIEEYLNGKKEKNSASIQ
ncbi:MAG: hypothetical protein NDI69_18230 [Bacteriovoracaceae bacterium]|nr:hypothetical protein [Bacteriovoracaceae bacterium]